VTWNPSTLAGLTWVNEPFYSYRTNQIALSGGGGLADPAVNAAFTYDDTAFGQVPRGLLATLATCAVNGATPGEPSGQYVQLLLSFVDELGRDYSTTAAHPGTNGGQITAFHAFMTGIGALTAVSDSDGIDFTTLLPWDMVALGAPSVYLLRPAALSWPGQDPGNTANRTVWLQPEVKPVAFGFTVNAQSAQIQVGFDVAGWTSGVAADVPKIPSTVTPGEQAAGLLALPR